MLIPIARPLIGEEERRAVLAVLESGRLTQGPCVEKFERAFAAVHRVRHGVATSSGTTALVASLMAHEIGPGDEVILPSFSFFATASAVLSVGATPVFADIEPTTFCLSTEAARAAVTERTRAILPVHLYGLPADMPALQALCRERELQLLEDAAQAHSAAIDGRPVGTWGTAAFSFHSSKNITTGEGGMVLTNDDLVAERLRRVRQHGASSPGLHETVGSNFRMSEVAAAIGLAQLGRLEQWQAVRRENARYYDEKLAGVVTPRTPGGFLHAYHQYTVRVPGAVRDEVVARLRERGIEARVYYERPIHRQPVFETSKGGLCATLPETERAAREVVSLPVHPGVTAEPRAFVVEQVNLALLAVRDRRDPASPAAPA